MKPLLNFLFSLIALFVCGFILCALEILALFMWDSKYMDIGGELFDHVLKQLKIKK